MVTRGTAEFSNDDDHRQCVAYDLTLTTGNPRVLALLGNDTTRQAVLGDPGRQRLARLIEERAGRIDGQPVAAQG